MDGFGKKIRELRLKKDMSLRDLGERSGLSYSFIGSLEKGRFKPSRETVYSLAEALNHPTEELLLLAGFAPDTPIEKNNPSPSEKKPDNEANIFYREWDKLTPERKQQAIDFLKYLNQLADEENNRKK